MFVRSNISSYNSTADPLTVLVVNGTVDVEVNSDPSVNEAIVYVTMLYPNTQLRETTHVCLMNIVDGNGLYIFVSPVFDLDSCFPISQRTIRAFEDPSKPHLSRLPAVQRVPFTAPKWYRPHAYSSISYKSSAFRSEAWVVGTIYRFR